MIIHWKILSLIKIRNKIVLCKWKTCLQFWLQEIHFTTSPEITAYKGMTFSLAKLTKVAHNYGLVQYGIIIKILILQLAIILAQESLLSVLSLYSVIVTAGRNFTNPLFSTTYCKQWNYVAYSVGHKNPKISFSYLSWITYFIDLLYWLLIILLTHHIISTIIFYQFSHFFQIVCWTILFLAFIPQTLPYRVYC